MYEQSNSARLPARPLACAVALALGCVLPVLSDAAANASVSHASLRMSTTPVGSRLHPEITTTVTVPVTNCRDDGSAGTLRDVFAHAVDGEEIDMSRLSCSKITLTMGELADSAAAANVSIVGNGQTIDGNAIDRVFLHSGDAYLVLDDLTITNGKSLTGGCVFSFGGVILAKTKVTGCDVSTPDATAAYGGGIFAQNGEVDVTNESVVSYNTVASVSGPVAGGGIWAHKVFVSTGVIYGNTAFGNSGHFGNGGGIFATRSGTHSYALSVNAATIAGNKADQGGGVFTEGMNITRSTFSNNFALSYGGAIFLRGGAGAYNYIGQSTISTNYTNYVGAGIVLGQGNNVTITGSTIVNNEGLGEGSGIYTSATSLVLNSTIISGNKADDPGLHPSNVVGLCPGGHCITTITGANNLIGPSNSAQALPPDTMFGVDPMLGDLRDNGGPTQTHALLAGSPAIDHGNNAGRQPTDQRGQGFEREANGRADIGAFEFPDKLFANGFE